MGKVIQLADTLDDLTPEKREFVKGFMLSILQRRDYSVLYDMLDDAERDEVDRFTETIRGKRKAD